MARCLALRAIPCTEEKFKTRTKTRLANLILGFPHVGWAYAPYKKPGKAGKAAPKDGNTKPLYESTSTDRLPNGGTWTTQVGLLQLFGRVGFFTLVGLCWINKGRLFNV